MRVIGGAARGRRLVAPRGLRTRPTAERVREALFDILGPTVVGMRVLDVFAGTGAVGIEALSRRAVRAVFLEHDREALRALRANLATLGFSGARARVIAGDALAALTTLATREGPFDLVFLDPPYARPEGSRALEALVAGSLLRDGARVVVQHFAKTPVPPVVGLVADRAPRHFGETTLTFLRARR